MNLVFVIKTMDSRGGGAERVLSQVTAELARRGHKITLVTFGAPGEPDFYPIHPTIHRVWLDAGDVQAPTRIIELVKRVWRTRHAIRQLMPDVAVGFMPSAYIPLSVALATSQIPVVASEHIGFDYFRDRPFERAALRLTAPLYARIFAISEAIKSEFPDSIAKRMTAMPNPVVPLGTYTDLEKPSFKKNLLNVGRLVEQKDQRTLIEAFAKIARAHPDWTLRIVGQGPLRSELKELISAKRLDKRVELPGTVSDMSKEYASAQLFVMSSRYESFGLATAEALAAGIPAVGFASCPGTNEIIQHEINGLLVEGVDRVGTLASGLSRLMGSETERSRLGRAAPETVKAFTLTGVVDRWEECLQAILP